MELVNVKLATVSSGSTVALVGIDSVEVGGMKGNAPAKGEDDSSAGVADNVFTLSSRARSMTEVGEQASGSGTGNDVLNFRAGGNSDLDGVEVDGLGDIRDCCSKTALSRAIEDFGLGASGGGTLRGGDGVATTTWTGVA